VITGTTSGTGYITAKEAVRKGANVLALNRPSGRSKRAIELLEASCENGGSVTQVDCDLSKFDSVAAAGAQVKALCKGSLDQLVCNAGVMMFPETQTTDGFDIQARAPESAPLQRRFIAMWPWLSRTPTLRPCTAPRFGFDFEPHASPRSRIDLRTRGPWIGPSSHIAPTRACRCNPITSVIGC